MANEFTLTKADPLDKQVTTVAVQYGEAVVAGRACYRKQSDGLHYLASSDQGEAIAKVDGFAVVGGAINEWGIVVQGGTIEVDNIPLVAGTVYCLAEYLDVAHTLQIKAYVEVNTVGEYYTILGTALDATSLLLTIKPTGVTV